MAFETLHYMKHQQFRKSSFMTLNLDMNKVYDRVELSFMKILLIKMGFYDKWVALMMKCMTIVSYSILINGKPFDIIHLSQGIRQGDLFSPSLFLLCTKGLHGLNNQASTSGHIKGISICRSVPRLSHLFFADDSILFCRAFVQECYYIQGLLKTYEEASW